MSARRKDWNSVVALRYENAKAPRRMMLFVVTVSFLARLGAARFYIDSPSRDRMRHH